MKFFALLLLVGLALGLGGCADGGHYTESQMAAQHSGYDPTGHTRGTRY